MRFPFFCSFAYRVIEKIKGIKKEDEMKTLEKTIPYCGNCLHKTKKDGLAKDEYYCNVVIDTPMKGVVTSDTDGTHCVELGIYRTLKQEIE